MLAGVGADLAIRAEETIFDISPRTIDRELSSVNKVLGKFFSTERRVVLVYITTAITAEIIIPMQTQSLV